MFIKAKPKQTKNPLKVINKHEFKLGCQSKRMQQEVNLNNSKDFAISYMDGAGDRVRNTLGKFFEDTKMERCESSVVSKSKI